MNEDLRDRFIAEIKIDIFSSVIFKTRSTNQQHQYLLENCEKNEVLDPTPDHVL